MYWIYFVIFTLIIFIPTIVHEGIMGLSVVQAQEYSILLLGTMGFVLFGSLEKRQKSDLREKNVMIGQMNRTNKDLAHSYLYIGEINRRLDIISNIVLGFPESSQLTLKKQRELYESIMEAIRLFGKSNDFVIRFTNLNTGEILKEIKSNDRVTINFPQKDCNPEVPILENNQILAIPSPKAMDNVYACIIVKKDKPQQSKGDAETMKVLAMQALSLFMLINKKKNGHKRNPQD
ncbi:MAG: hypothetical protein WCF93_04365 [Candidatus Moraniibacteriota bacterium]